MIWESLRHVGQPNDYSTLPLVTKTVILKLKPASESPEGLLKHRLLGLTLSSLLHCQFIGGPYRDPFLPVSGLYLQWGLPGITPQKHYVLLNPYLRFSSVGEGPPNLRSTVGPELPGAWPFMQSTQQPLVGRDDFKEKRKEKHA